MNVRLPVTPSELGHLFRKKRGHLVDTPENRQLLLDVAADPTARLESDQYGNVWAARLRADGRQVWVQLRDGVIVNGGMNEEAKTFNPQTGLKRR